MTVHASSPYPSPGDIVDGKYRCERMVGEGGMGAVLQATHILRKASVALKFMNPEIATREGYVERFINEAVAASRIDSEHVVKVFDVGQIANGTPFLVMEYLEGCDLGDIIDRQGTNGIASIPRCLHFIVQSLSGLQQAHDAGIIHRDMKPSNCFVVSKDGDDDFIKLLDFGISKVHEPTDVKLTQTNSLLGTPLYMSPEQSRSAKLADARSDLYSVGVILYELLTGRPPFDSDSSFADLLIKIATMEPVAITTLRPDVPEELARVVRKAFARNPDDRFSSAFAFSEALVPWCDDRSISVIERARRRAGASGCPSSIMSQKASYIPLIVRSGSTKAPSDPADISTDTDSNAHDAAKLVPGSAKSAHAIKPKSRSRTLTIAAITASALLIAAGSGAIVTSRLWEKKEDNNVRNNPDRNSVSTSHAAAFSPNGNPVQRPDPNQPPNPDSATPVAADTFATASNTEPDATTAHGDASTGNVNQSPQRKRPAPVAAETSRKTSTPAATTTQPSKAEKKTGFNMRPWN